MAFEVIMPALGMAQDTGKLVAWLKAVGDTVAADEPLMEVETDKTTMEVDAGHAGVIAELRSAEGEDVPVGQVIAVIAAEGETIETRQAESPAAEAIVAPEPAPEPLAATPEAVPEPEPAAAAVSGDRILASPKAKRLAQERGIDLAALVASGVGQPIHVKDLNRAPVAGAPVAPEADIGAAAVTLPEATQARRAALSFVSAVCDSAAFDAFISRARDEGGISVEPYLLVASFVAGALRAVTDAEAVAVALEVGIGGRRVTYLDPDFNRPTRPRFAPEDAAPSIIVRDMTGHRITAIGIAADSVPALSLARDGGGHFSLSLAFDTETLMAGQAIRLVEDVASRFESPLGHLI